MDKSILRSRFEIEIALLLLAVKPARCYIMTGTVGIITTQKERK